MAETVAPSMETLDEIAIRHGTDKATVHPHKGHDYTLHYQTFFEPIRKDAIKFLEIGVGGGESIRTWLEYFPRAKVFGVDNIQGTNPWNTVKSGIHSRYTFVCGDQAHGVFWKCFIADYGSNWDVIMDDGGHFSNQVITSFDSLFPELKSGGLYCIEDLGVAYGPGSVFLIPGWQNHMDFVKNKLDDINLKREIAFIHFSRELAIMKKA